MEQPKDDDVIKGCLTLIGLALVVFLFVGGGVFRWYKAGVQADVYGRAGIQMSQWEVFIGTKTPERTIRVAE